MEFDGRLKGKVAVVAGATRGGLIVEIELPVTAS